MALPLTDSEELTKKIYEEAGLELPADLGTSLQQVQQQVAAQQAQQAAAAPAPVRPTPPAVQALPADLDDKALARAYLEKQNKTYLAQAMNGVALISRGFGGSMPLNAGDAFIRNADNDIDAIQGRRAQANQDLQRADAQHKRDLEAYGANPLSEENQFVTDLLRKHYGSDPQVASFLEQPRALGLGVKDALMLANAHEKSNRTNAMGEPALTEEQAEVRARFMQNLNGWDEARTQLYKQTLTGATGKDGRKQADIAMGGERVKASRDIAAGAQAGATARSIRSIEDRQQGRTEQQVGSFGKEVSDSTAAIKTTLGKLGPILGAAKQKYGAVPGANLVSDFVGKNRLSNAYLNSPEEKEIRGLVESMNILNRVDITGAAFGEKEAADLRSAYADLLTTDNLEQSLGRLAIKVDSAIKKAYASKNPQARALIQQMFPELVQGIDVPSSPAPALPTAQPVVDPADDAAAKWVLKNPTHPKAVEIRERLAKKGIKVQ